MSKNWEGKHQISRDYTGMAPRRQAPHIWLLTSVRRPGPRPSGSYSQTATVPGGWLWHNKKEGASSRLGKTPSPGYVSLLALCIKIMNCYCDFICILIHKCTVEAQKACLFWAELSIAQPNLFSRILKFSLTLVEVLNNELGRPSKFLTTSKTLV